MNDCKVSIVSSDDWSGLYINDNLECEWRFISTFDILSRLEGKVLKKFEYIEADNDWMHDVGNLPIDLIDVVRA